MLLYQKGKTGGGKRGPNPAPGDRGDQSPGSNLGGDLPRLAHGKTIAVVQEIMVQRSDPYSFLTINKLVQLDLKNLSLPVLI
jgi:hypothetical protein